MVNTTFVDDIQWGSIADPMGNIATPIYQWIHRNMPMDCAITNCIVYMSPISMILNHTNLVPPGCKLAHNFYELQSLQRELLFIINPGEIGIVWPPT